jgi:hypothetical protein
MRSASGEAAARSSRTPARVALATCAELPELDADSQRLSARLVELGVSVTAAVWDDPSHDWDTFDLVVVRSCWDYVHRREQFLEWCASVTNLANPAAVLSWNTDKRYLQRLERCGVPTVPTHWLTPDQPWCPPDDGEWVIKPVVSIASLDTGRYRMADAVERRLAAAHVTRLQRAGRAVMVQPYMRAIDVEGETSLVFLGGAFSHAVSKTAALCGPDQGVDRRFLPAGGLRLREHRVTAAELAVAERALAAAPCAREDLLYARVDLIPGECSDPLLIELELTEPQLYLDRERAVERLADVIALRAAATSLEEAVI